MRRKKITIMSSKSYGDIVYQNLKDIQTEYKTFIAQIIQTLLKGYAFKGNLLYNTKIAQNSYTKAVKHLTNALAGKILLSDDTRKGNRALRSMLTKTTVDNYELAVIMNEK